MTSIPDASSSQLVAVGAGGTGPARLDGGQERTWQAFLAASRLIFERIERELASQAGMPHAYYEIMIVLSEAPRRSMRMSDLAESSTSSRSRLSHAVARLEENGWVERRSCPQDRRGAFAELTEKGMEVIVSAAPGHVRAVRSVLFDALTADQAAALGEVAQAIVAHHEACSRAGRLISDLSGTPR